MNRKNVSCLVIGMLAFNLSACAGGHINTEKYIGKHRLYADLEKVRDTEFKLTKLGTDASLPIVVNDLSTTMDTREHYCGTYSFNSPIKKNQVFCTQEHLFRRTKVDKGVTVAGTILTAGTGALMGMNSKVSCFDFESYNQAVRSAIKESDRIKYISKFDEFVVANQQLAEKHIENEKTLDDGYTQLYDKHYNIYLNNTADTKIKLTIDDKSGFYDGSITPNMLLSMKQNDLKIQKLSLPPLKHSFTSTVDAFEETMADILRCNNQSIISENSVIKDEHSKYSEFLKKKTSYLLIANKNINNLNNYNIAVSTPDTVEINHEGETVVNVMMKIHSKNFPNVRPRFVMNDKNLQFTFDGKIATLKNMTKQYVKVENISIYYNNKVITIPFATDLAPESYKEDLFLANELFSKIEPLNNYLDMTALKAQKLTVSYGYAVRYHVVETNLNNTLYKTSKFPLLKILTAEGR
ncbi:hypothetical protein [Geomonas edaphica]|uniref:hypothetical protein n=1 Tax=Geomonas edaphica TaxID=2570226 RepID=UPI0010A93AE5|nr:hypothetical protein [Geomonas edaphica]